MSNYPKKGLIIREPWIDLLLDGRKKWEIRGSDAKHRGLTGLVKSKSKAVFGTAELTDVIGPIPIDEFDSFFELHRVNRAEFNVNYPKIYAWVFENPCRYAEPKPYEHKLGSVIWVSL